MPVIDLRDLSRERARIDEKPHSFPRCLRGRVPQRVAQVQMVDDDWDDLEHLLVAEVPARASWKGWNAASASVSAARVSASV